MKFILLQRNVFVFERLTVKRENDTTIKEKENKKERKLAI